ncbi:MAG: hypothetical protein HYX38_09970 [Rhodospirillales bacterium]|nr:hypothetical protein [Rhodospirillales bacterium]
MSHIKAASFKATLNASDFRKEPQMPRIGMLELAGLFVFASLGAAAQQPAPAPPAQGQQMQQMPMEHGTGGMTQGQGTNQGQSGGMGMGQGANQGQGQGQGGMGGMMDHMQKMHPGSSTPPSSAHAPAPTPTPQCPAGTTIQMDEKGQHICK